jgi:putative toxin-antitoxin system antitoxin component (TIGR02293 family)
MSSRALAKKLGGRAAIGRDLKTDADLIGAVREGLPTAAMDAVVDGLANDDISRSDVYRIIGSERTLQRRIRERLPLSALESDRLARLARIWLRAEEALGSSPRSRQWLARPNRALRGQRPIDLLDSDTGTLAVDQVLGRIEHGVYE